MQFSSVGGASAPHADTAAGPVSNPTLSGYLLIVISPLSASPFPVSLYYNINSKQQAQKYTLNYNLTVVV